jgi:hypothetical protein
MKNRQQVIRALFVAAAAAILLSLVSVVGRSQPTPTGPKIGFIDGAGKMVVAPQYDEIGAWFSEGVASVF